MWQAMADIAVVFHWSPPDLDDMHPGDLLRWHKLALERLPETEVAVARNEAQITIRAVDKVTETVRRVNEAMNRVVAPCAGRAGN